MCNKQENIFRKRETVKYYLENLRQIISNYDSSSIYTMDEILICFDELGRRNFEIFEDDFEIEENGSRSNCELTRMLNIVLTTLADGTLLPTLIICHRTSAFLRIRKHFNISLNLKEDYLQLDIDNQSMKKLIWDILKPHSPGKKLLVLRETHAVNKQALELLNEIDCELVAIPRGFKDCLHPMDSWTYERPSLKKVFSDYLKAEWQEWHKKCQSMSSSEEIKFTEQVLIDMLSRALLELSNESELIRNVILFY